MDRRDILLSGFALETAQGLEIGALDRPIVSRDQGQIFYIDFTDTATLRKNYADHPYIEASKLVEVDGIWGKQTLAEAAAAVAPVDYVIASHVIEHVPDLLAWFDELHSVLKSAGCIKLAIPDRRYTFDYFRSETRLSDIIHAHVAGARVPLAREVIDYVLNSTQFDMVDAWRGLHPAEPKPWIDRMQRAIELGKEAENGIYHDSHCWVFTPLSFVRLMEQLAETQFLKFSCKELVDTAEFRHEFFVALVPETDKNKLLESWSAQRRILEQREKDLAASHIGDQEPTTAEAEADAGAEVAKQLALRTDEVALLQGQLAELALANRELRASTSWRITAPLRAVKDALTARKR